MDLIPGDPVGWKHLPKLLPRKFRRLVNPKKQPEFNRRVEQTLLRVLSLANDEMTELSSDIQGIKYSTYGVINMLEDAEVQQKSSKAAGLWLIKLEQVAYEAELVLDELSYEVGRQKVHHNSFDRSFLEKIENVNRAIQMIYDDGRPHFRPSESSSLALRYRLCLGFCLSFPKDFLIQKSELIQLWLAAGLLQSFDEGNYCFESFSRSTLQEVEYDEDGNVGVYKIDHKSSSKYKNTSSVCFLYATTSMSIRKDTANKLRTLILDGVPFQESWKLKRLGILVFLNSADMEMLPSIERLKHLRYLDVSNTRIKALPEFITELYNLETLRFLHCKELSKLPTKFNNLVNLKNIAFSFEHQIPFGLGQMTCLETLSFFAVGSNRGGGIQELRNLNRLRGQLELTRLEEVRDRKEAETANVQQKATIGELSFQWSYGAHDRSSNDEEVLEGLKPRPHIRKIKIKYYMGQDWPSWMLRTRSPSDGDSFVLHNLVSLTLERCWNCVQLPCLGEFSCLRFLTIRHMGKVKSIYNELYKENDSESSYNSHHLFPVLKSLSLSWMENLSDWSSGEKPLNNKKVVVLPQLETLSIQSCPKLASFPLEDLSTLVKIEIKDCDELRFLFHEQSFPSLANLSIEGCPKLTYLRNQLLSKKHLYEFKVRRCEWLKFISDDLEVQSSLVSLELNCCRGFTFFSDEIFCKLTQLRKLSIGAFSEKLDDFRYLNQIKDLPHLKDLEIWGSDCLDRKMSHLPHQLQHLTRLESLKIMGFTVMQELPVWLSDLQSLQCLSLNYCWHLGYQSTATIIQGLPNLKQLYINGCHTLEQNKSQWNGFSRSSKIKILYP